MIMNFYIHKIITKNVSTVSPIKEIVVQAAEKFIWPQTIKKTLQPERHRFL